MNSTSIPQLTALLAAKAAESRALKQLLRTRWVRPMAETQRSLVRLQRRLTDLHVLRAHLRGRAHLTKPLRDGAFPGMTWDSHAWHAETAARVARELGLPAEHTRARAPLGAAAEVA